MNTKLKRLLLPLLRAAAKGAPPTFRMRSAASQAIFLLGKATSKSKGGRLRRIQKRTGWAEETKAICEEVFRRAGWRCENCCHDDRTVAIQLDHWLGGVGRRRQQQTFKNTWALCEACHRDRTANQPSAEYWNGRFARHCLKYGYDPSPHITHAQLKRSAP